MSYIDYRDKKEIGKTGEYVSAIGLGTWNIIDYKKALETYVYAIEMGIDNIDTAEIYGGGKAEEFIGEVIKRVDRENIFLTTKLTPLSLSDTYKAIKSAEASLNRMGIDTVDLILTHWNEYNIPINRQIRSLEILIDKGYTRYIGVSNYNLSEIEEALYSLSKYDIVVNQVRYNVYDKWVERELLSKCIEYKITIQAYTPLERGHVAKDNRLMKIGDKYNKSPIQVALNYLISHNRVIAIPKTEKKYRVDEFLGSLGWRLSDDDIKFIRENVF